MTDPGTKLEGNDDDEEARRTAKKDQLARPGKRHRLIHPVGIGQEEEIWGEQRGSIKWKDGRRGGGSQAVVRWAVPGRRDSHWSQLPLSPPADRPLLDPSPDPRWRVTCDPRPQHTRHTRGQCTPISRPGWSAVGKPITSFGSLARVSRVPDSIVHNPTFPSPCKQEHRHTSRHQEGSREHSCHLCPAPGRRPGRNQPR